MPMSSSSQQKKEFERFKRRLALINALSNWLKSQKLEETQNQNELTSYRRLSQYLLLFLQSTNPEDTSSEGIREIINGYYKDCMGLDRAPDQSVTPSQGPLPNANQDTTTHMMATLGQSLTPDESNTIANRIALDIAAFLEGIEIYFQPHEYPHLFPAEERPSGQHAERSFPLVAPIQHEGSLLKRIGVSCHACTKQIPPSLIRGIRNEW